LSFGALEGGRSKQLQRSWEHVHTHTQGLIIVQDLHQVMQPHIHLFSLYMGFEVAYGFYTLVCFWACSHVVSSPCNKLEEQKEEQNLKKHKVEEKKNLSTRHYYRAHGCECSAAPSPSIVVIIPFSFHSTFVVVPFILFCPMFFTILSDIRQRPYQCPPVRPAPSIHRCPFDIVHPRQHTIFFKSYLLRTNIANIVFFKPYVVLELCS